MGERGEASVEEILDSIKKVIARDNRASASAERRHREMKGVPQLTQHSDSEEVFDLSGAEMVDEGDDGSDDAFFITDDREDEQDSLIRSSVRGMMQENFAALSMLAEPGARPQIVRSGETSLEGLVREMLRPMLAEWLDKNLPGMVERMVKAEIARIARKRG